MVTDQLHRTKNTTTTTITTPTTTTPTTTSSHIWTRNGRPGEACNLDQASSICSPQVPQVKRAQPILSGAVTMMTQWRWQVGHLNFFLEGSAPCKLLLVSKCLSRVDFTKHLKFQLTLLKKIFENQIILSAGKSHQQRRRRTRAGEGWSGKEKRTNGFPRTLADWKRQREERKLQRSEQESQLLLFHLSGTWCLSPAFTCSSSSFSTFSPRCSPTCPPSPPPRRPPPATSTTSPSPGTRRYSHQWGGGGAAGLCQTGPRSSFQLWKSALADPDTLAAKTEDLQNITNIYIQETEKNYVKYQMRVFKTG